MITLFAAPKPFNDQFNAIQTRAILSWKRLIPPCEIILFGDEKGTAEKAASFNIKHVPMVAKNEYGTPLLNDLFAKAQSMAVNNLVGYVNADIILMSDFMEAVANISGLNKPFLLVGRRWDVNLENPPDFAEPDFEKKLRAYVLKKGFHRHFTAIDYFVFPRGLYRTLPPFAIGRPAFDNWLLWKAYALGARLIDASDIIMAVHQNHNYSHHPHGEKGVWEGPEAQRNRKLLKTWRHCFLISDAPYRLTSRGLGLNFTCEHLKQRFYSIKVLPLEWIVIFMNKTRKIRRKFGFEKSGILFIKKTWIRIFSR